MAYFLNLFTPETWQAFQENGSNVSGFRYRQRRMAREQIHSGDVFICYLVRLSRWCGALRIVSEAYEDDEPIFDKPDPFVIRFKVEPIILLDPMKAIPIFEDEVWDNLSETRGIEKGAKGWAKYYRGSLRRMDDADGTHLLKSLEHQANEQHEFELTDRDRRQLARKQIVRTIEGEVAVTVPDEEDDIENYAAEELTESPTDGVDARQSIQIQATLTEIGTTMGFKVWLPRSDKVRVSALLSDAAKEELLDSLPLNYDVTTLDTIGQIDVIWLRGQAISRAFEVEHTTAVYSGLLRMADLLALQPNMDIRLHIVAPPERRDKVFREMMRPVFSLLGRGPLYKSCTYISYDNVDAIAKLEFLSHTSDSVLEEYEEEADI